jgi:hypothetical protein
MQFDQDAILLGNRSGTDPKRFHQWHADVSDNDMVDPQYLCIHSFASGNNLLQRT